MSPLISERIRSKEKCPLYPFILLAKIILSIAYPVTGPPVGHYQHDVTLDDDGRILRI
jgi:hypothetical protein